MVFGRISRSERDASRRYTKGAYHTKISDTKELHEIEKVSDRLETDEEVLLVTRQTKNPLKPGGSLFTPNSIIITDRKIILRDPSALGLRQKLEVFRFDTIVDLKMERGAFSVAIDVNVPGLGYSRIDAISKDDAEQILRIYQEYMQKTKDIPKNSKNVNSETGSVADELLKLAKLKEQEIISNEEFQQMKKDLMSKI